MARPKHYDAVIIGGGAAGISAAEVINRAGFSVCIVEAKTLGGECPNEACVPTKALLHSAKLYHSLKQGTEQFGVYTGKVGFRFSEIMEWRKEVVQRVTGNGQRFAKAFKQVGIEVVYGEAVFLDAHRLEVGKKLLEAKTVIIATGGSSFIPPIAGLDQVPYWTYQNAVSAKTQPKSLTVIGAGPVGIEFATFYAMLGTKVQIVQLEERILPREDGEIAAFMEQKLEELGVQIFCDAKTLSVEKFGKKKRITIQQGEEEKQKIFTQEVLIATGKRPRLARLHIEKAEIQTDDYGHIRVDKGMRSSQKHIFAAGDVVNRMQFTHTAHTSGVVAGENAVRVLEGKRGIKSLYDDRVVPRVTFTAPEVASVGVTKVQAQQQGVKAVEGSFPFMGLGRAIMEGKTEGLAKIVIREEDRVIIGASIAGERAGELIHEVALAMSVNMTVDAFAERIRAFPTFSEIHSAVASMV